MMMKEKGKIVNILEVEEDDKERNRGAALLSIYNEFKDEIKAIRTDIQHLNIQQPQQSENNQELNSLLKETIVNAVNDTINAHINSRENYADEVSRRCKNTIDFAIERETKLVNNVVFPKLSPIIVTRNFAASLFRNIKYFTLRKLYLCRKWMQKRLQKTTTTGITLPNFDFLA
ncbi:hypothetical protein K0F15_19600 [Phocaeicola vulgatus]|uniref:hypothetical protein n=1 Tax=Phocaeicola vulgatus TaxID=821 RepID=UPI001F203375|nr:hypothetical protein [Phocaeicola vulgatus]MCE8863420.1 hypothetical protein [Phocaeicola vulgatus]